MAISVQGIRLKSLKVDFNDKGIPNVAGTYELVSSTNVVLATQNFNGYNDMQLNLPHTSMAELRSTLDTIRGDINKILGLE